MRSFERALSVASEELEIELRARCPVPWADFWLNPRRLRGSDFLMRWSQGVWTEKRVAQAVNETGKYFGLPYGPSSTAPDNDVRAHELYFERLEQAGLRELKRPDLLIFRVSDAEPIKTAVDRLGGEQELPFTPEKGLEELLSRAIVALECENSLWQAGQMPDYGSELRRQRRLGGKPGLPKNAVLPTVILKEEDRRPLRKWQGENGIQIHLWHLFYDLAFGIALDTTEDLIRGGLISPTDQVFQAPGGATTTKVIFKVYYHYAYAVGSAEQEPALRADYITDKNGHILPYVRFEGGRMKLGPDALAVLDEAAEAKHSGKNGKRSAKDPRRRA